MKWVEKTISNSPIVHNQQKFISRKDQRGLRIEQPIKSKMWPFEWVGVSICYRKPTLSTHDVNSFLSIEDEKSYQHISHLVTNYWQTTTMIGTAGLTDVNKPWRCGFDEWMSNCWIVMPCFKLMLVNGKLRISQQEEHAVSDGNLVQTKWSKGNLYWITKLYTKSGFRLHKDYLSECRAKM